MQGFSLLSVRADNSHLKIHQSLEHSFTLGALWLLWCSGCKFWTSFSTETEIFFGAHVSVLFVAQYTKYFSIQIIHVIIVSFTHRHVMSMHLPDLFPLFKSMEDILRCFIKDGQPDMNRQIEFIIKQLNSCKCKTTLTFITSVMFATFFP